MGAVSRGAKASNVCHLINYVSTEIGRFEREREREREVVSREREREREREKRERGRFEREREREREGGDIKSYGEQTAASMYRSVHDGDPLLCSDRVGGVRGHSCRTGTAKGACVLRVVVDGIVSAQ